jgi:hypothetical protein
MDKYMERENVKNITQKQISRKTLNVKQEAILSSTGKQFQQKPLDTGKKFSGARSSSSFNQGRKSIEGRKSKSRDGRKSMERYDPHRSVQDPYRPNRSVEKRTTNRSKSATS